MLFLEQEFNDAGFETEIVHGEVLVVKNFASKNEVDIILEIINNTPEDVWFKAYNKGLG